MCSEKVVLLLPILPRTLGSLRHQKDSNMATRWQESLSNRELRKAWLCCRESRIRPHSPLVPEKETSFVLFCFLQGYLGLAGRAWDPESEKLSQEQGQDHNRGLKSDGHRKGGGN